MWMKTALSLYKYFSACVIIAAISYFSLFAGNSQNSINVKDSLLDTYHNSENDSVKIEALVKIAYLIETDSIIRSLDYSSDNYIQIAGKLANDSSTINQLALRLDRYGVNLRNDGNYVSALKFHNRAKDIAKGINNINLNSIIFNNIGVVYRRLDDYQSALTNHLEALSLAEQTRNLKSQAIAINSIGNIQMMIGNLDESLENFKQSLIIEQKLDDLLGVAINLNNIGNVYLVKDDYNKALEYFLLSLDVNNEIHSQRGVAICYTDIGKVYKLWGNISKSLSYYLDALVINKAIADKYNLAYTYIQVGELYTQMENYEKALSYLEPGIKLALDIGAKSFIVDGYTAMYNITLAQGKFINAINYLELSHQYHDSILNINVRKDITRLQIKYDSERKQDQIELLESNIAIAELDEKRQYVIILLILSALIIAVGFVIFLTYYLYSKNTTNKLLIERNRRIEEAKTKLDSYSSQLLIAKQEAEKNSKVKSEFLANMSHEIRTPLNSVIGFADILENSLKDPKNINQLSAIKSSARTLLTLINDILDLSKIEAGKFTVDIEPINLEYILEDVVNIFSYRAIEKKIILTTNISPDMPTVIMFNELRLRQILFNLLGNAIKFTEDGEIILEAISKLHDKGNELALTINVNDTGIGICEEDLEDVFEPFHQSRLNNNDHGTGLGLAITKRLVEMLNGTINLTSREGVGSRFSIYFPKIKISHSNWEPVKLKKNGSISLLMLTNNIESCDILKSKGLANFNNEIVYNLNDAKLNIQNRSIVIICGYDVEKVHSSIKVLQKAGSKHNLSFIVIGNNSDIKAMKMNEKVFCISDSIEKKELVQKIKSIISTSALREKSSLYFNEFLSLVNDQKFVSDLQSIYTSEFKKSNETKMSSSIISFISALQLIADKYNLSGLKLYCKELGSKINNFEIEDLDNLLSLFEVKCKQIVNTNS